MELKYSSRGARLIEVNCRMGGGVVRNMNLLVWGVDMAEEQLLCSAGRQQPAAHLARAALVLVWLFQD